MLNAAAVHEQECFNLLRAVAAACSVATLSIAETETAEAGVDEEFGAGLLRHGDAGDELGGAGEVDRGDLLEEGEADNLVKKMLVDGCPSRTIKCDHEVVVFTHVAHVFDGFEID